MSGWMKGLVSGISRLTITTLSHQPANSVHAGRCPLIPVTCHSCLSRKSSTYKPYPNIKTPSPYKKKERYHYGYENKLYCGEVMPRPKGKYENKPLPIPMWRPHKKDAWVPKKAAFGQNDYIDLLGDGSVHPYQTMTGPNWLKGFRGNEMQRLIRQVKFRGAYLREMYPTKYHNIQKRLFFLNKRMNRRKHTPYWGNRKSSAISRIDRKNIP